jgi:hypothetical protein
VTLAIFAIVLVSVLALGVATDWFRDVLGDGRDPIDEEVLYGGGGSDDGSTADGGTDGSGDGGGGGSSDDGGASGSGGGDTTDGGAGGAVTDGGDADGGGGSTGSVSRVVLIEEFTATWCQYCPEMGEAVEQIADDYGAGQVALIKWHVQNSGDGSLSTPEGDKRLGQYDASGIPDMHFDHVERISGRAAPSVEGCYNAIEEKVELRLPYDSAVLMTARGETDGDELSIAATIEAVGDVPNSELKVTFVIYENGVSYEGEKHNYVVRDMMKSTVKGGELTGPYSKTFGLDDGWNGDKMGAVVFVQVGDSGTILQAANVELD